MSDKKQRQIADGNYIAQADRGGIASISVVQEIARLSPSEKRNRFLMLKKVRDFWVRDVLHNSLYKAVLIDLGMEYKPDAVTYPWKLFFQETKVQIETEIPFGTNIASIFDEQEGELLILGDPGCGKTTMLLHLAENLLDRAELDESLPIPVVFNLSSWSEQKPDVGNWITEELSIRYGVPNKIGQNWVKKDNVLLLLDGLDEVSKDQREKCVEALNDYRIKHGFASIVVCSRVADYEILETKLKLQSAIFIKPLTLNQVDIYLLSLGESMVKLRQIIKDDIEIQSLSQYPVLLNIMVMAYSKEEDFLLDEVNSKDKQSELFATYINKMFSRRLDQTKFSSKDTVEWLTWLAKQMQVQGQSVFYLENLQPNWLEKNQQRIYSFILNILIKLQMAVLLGVFVGLPFGLGWGIGAGLVATLLWRFKSDSKIQTIDTLSWSWVAFRAQIGKSLLGGLQTAVFVALISTITGFSQSRFFWSTIIAIGLANSLGNALVGGLTGNQVEVRNRPNQGMRRSFYNSILGGIVYAIIASLACIVLFPVVGNVFLSIIVSAIMGFIAGSLINGGYTCIQHYTIRFLLWRNKSTPFNYVYFLDYAVDRIFLRRVGGGYIFIHRLPMEYFASLSKELSEKVNPEKEVSQRDMGFILLIAFLLILLVATIISIIIVATTY